jgi:hypothetical protein
MSRPHRFHKHYTLDEARELLPAVQKWLAEIRLLRQAVGRATERNSELLAGGRDLGGERINDQLRSLVRLKDLLAEFERREITIKDLGRGLLDFPALRGDHEILLCWEEGELDIEFWHDLDAGFAGRQRV